MSSKMTRFTGPRSDVRNRDANPARRAPRAETRTVQPRAVVHRPKPMHPTAPPPAEADWRSSFNWVKLESSAEAPDLHVTAAPGYRTPKRSIPHAAYRRDRPPPKRPSATLRRGNPERPSAAEATLRDAAGHPSCRSGSSEPAERAGHRSDRRATALPPAGRSRWVSTW